MKTNLSLKIALIALISGAPALVTGCTTVGPDYQTPEVSTPDEFRAPMTASEASSFADLPWWQVYSDESLQGLIREGVANNHDVQIAATRIEQARALVGIVNSQSKPQVNYGARAGIENSFVPTVSGGAGTADYSSIGVGLDAVWEIDMWGRIKRATEAAEANLMATEEMRSGVLLTLVGDIAGGYFRLLELDRELAIARESSRVYKKTLDLFSARYEAGRDNRLPVQRAQAAYDSSLARIEDVKRAIGQQENALSILVGDYPRDIPRGRALDQQAVPAMGVGSTTAMLQRRPDIREAEQTMRKANAEVGVALANQFPRIGLGALVGGLGINMSGDTDSFTVGGIALSVTGPIFTGGRLQAVYDSRQAFWDETIVQYRKTVVTAFRETSDALVAQQTLGRRIEALEHQVAALRDSSRLALLRYDAGRASYFEVLEAQQQLFPAEDALAQAQRDRLLTMVSLYKALGGGWQSDEPQAVAQAGDDPATP